MYIFKSSSSTEIKLVYAVLIEDFWGKYRA